MFVTYVAILKKHMMMICFFNSQQSVVSNLIPIKSNSLRNSSPLDHFTERELLLMQMPVGAEGG